MTPRDRIVVAVIAVLVGLGAYWFLALKPKREELGRLNADLAQQEQRRDAAQSQIRAGEAARADYGDHARTLARIGKAVPADDQLATLVYQIQATAKKQDVDFVSVDVANEDAAGAAPADGTAAPAGAPTPVPFTMTFEGKFFEVERFLSALEKYTTTRPSGETVVTRGRLVTLNGVTVGAADGGFPNITVTLTAAAYTLPKADVAVPATTPAPAPGAAAAPTTPSTPAPTTAAARGVTP